VDTVLFADAANRAATNRNQWYVAISRGRKRVVVFTSDKDGLRANIARTGDRELALELKPSAAVPALPDGPRQRPAWLRQAWASIERVRCFQLVQSHRTRARQVQHMRIHL
jgi:hypothetical protein